MATRDLRGGRERYAVVGRWVYSGSTCIYCHKLPPVISGDASSTCPCGLFVLLVVVGIDVGLLRLLLQDISKLVFADAAKEGANIMRLLDHPLQTVHKNTHLRTIFPEGFDKADVCMTDLSNLYGILGCPSSMVLDFEILHELIKSKHTDKFIGQKKMIITKGVKLTKHKDEKQVDGPALYKCNTPDIK